MSIRIRCPHCGRYFGAPDLDSVKTYAANGGFIQTLTERITAQPIHYHYVTPGPLWKAAVPTLLQIFLGPAEVKLGLDPFIAFGLIGVIAGIGLVVASTEVEEREIPDEPPTDDEPEAEQIEPEPVRFEEITRTNKNSVSIRWPHEPPHDPDPKAQQRLYHADLALAKAVTDIENPLAPISWTNVQKRQIGIGEPTFYRIERHWIREGLAFKTDSGAVYLKPSGTKTLAQYASQ